MLINPVFANDSEKSNDDDLDTENVQDKKSSLKEQKKSKKKKGERNVKVQPDKEDDKNIILELDRT